MAKALLKSITNLGASRLPDAAVLLSAISDPVLAVDGENIISFANPAAEQFFSNSAQGLLGTPLHDLIVPDSPLFGLIQHARNTQSSASEHELMLRSPRIESHVVSVTACALPEIESAIVLTIHSQSIARKIGHQMNHRDSARSVRAMSAMLAHEIKNPLSGIRGAAQLLETAADENDRQLTQLICNEADRIVALVDRMEMFSNSGNIDLQPVNIHEVLNYVRTVAETGFAKQVRFLESYDPSLPPVLGNRDLLIQTLLNLVKNAAEACEEGQGQITLTSRYQQGVRLMVPGLGKRVDLPLVISVEDNGSGIPEDLQRHLFDPFVSSKPKGKGLGLALVAKIVGDHGGIVEFDSQPRRTIFRLMLPKADG